MTNTFQIWLMQLLTNESSSKQTWTGEDNPRARLRVNLYKEFIINY